MTSNNFVLNRLFTKQVINDLIQNNSNDIYVTIIQQYLNDYKAYSNKEILNKIYTYMSKNYRNEYFYQNTLLNKLLLGRHSIKTTTALTQIPIERSKADFVLINGKAVVYEIKTELDSFDRLSTQLNDYYKAFDHVCVVTCEENIGKISEIVNNTKVGICILSKANTLQFKKEPESNKLHLNHHSLFKVLRKYEYENIIISCLGELPNATPAFYYDECLQLFKRIPLEKVYKLFLIELKKRNKDVPIDEFQSVPYELKSIMYFSRTSHSQYEKLRKFLDTTYLEANKCIIHM
ncbi:MAG: sce7726 family protein [Enterococcus aquimarinus]